GRRLLLDHWPDAALRHAGSPGEANRSSLDRPYTHSATEPRAAGFAEPAAAVTTRTWRALDAARHPRRCLDKRQCRFSSPRHTEVVGSQGNASLLGETPLVRQTYPRNVLNQNAGSSCQADLN